MLHRISMPSLSATMEEGTIISWRVREGDPVNAGDILLELESDKSTFEFESPCSGVVRRILAGEGQTVPVQRTIAIVGGPDEEIPEEWLGEDDEEIEEAASSIPGADSVKSFPERPAGKSRLKISPKARKLAEKLNVDFAKVKGTGPGGRIESGDIEKAAKQSPRREGLIPFSTGRKKINRLVTQSKQQTPHFYIGTVVDMTSAVEFRKKLAAEGDDISYNVLLMKAVVEGLGAEPMLNVQLAEGGYVPRKYISVGLAIETDRGVVVAVIGEVDKLEIAELSKRIDEAVSAARGGRVEDLDSSGASMTISNLGKYRVETFIPIIHPGQAAILGIGSIAERPVAAGGKIVIRKTMSVTLAVDHRIADGAVAARFMEAFAKYLEGLS